jgi:hypothetical protein
MTHGRAEVEMATGRSVQNSNDDLLVSWKDIAAYLKCSVRKAQRLEEQGLPVNRMPGAKSVWATKSDIDRWLALASRGAKRQSSQVPLNHGVHPGALIVLVILVAATIAAVFASTYALAIASFSLTAVAAVLLYPWLPDTIFTRAAISVGAIAGMAYTATATNLPGVVDSTVNMTTLRPAIAYPFAQGLRFIPILVLLCAFLATVPLFKNEGFTSHPRLRQTYILLGLVWLAAAAAFPLAQSGALRIWHAGLAIRSTLVAGELFIWCVNIALFVAGYFFFNRTQVQGYRQFLLRCGMGYLLIALTAAIVNRHWNEIDRHFLDVRQAQAYRSRNSNAIPELQNWLRTHAAEAGQDFVALSADPDFLRALNTQDFYKRDFDEAFQGARKAVIFGYKEPAAWHKRASFVLVRFPIELSTALRFEPFDEQTVR